jgi:putative transcriptional regulator
MDFLNLNRPVNNTKLIAGKLLIAEPFLTDPNFARSVILLCEHGDEGSVGFILNRPIELTLGDLLPDLFTPMLGVNKGGPVQLDTLHMLHRMPQILGGNRVAKDIYWGGSYDHLQDMVSEKNFTGEDLRLFVGYAGWTPGQLEKEIDEGSWMISDATPDILFETDADRIWKKSIWKLGKEYAYLANMPLNPQLN